MSTASSRTRNHQFINELGAVRQREQALRRERNRLQRQGEVVFLALLRQFPATLGQFFSITSFVATAAWDDKRQFANMHVAFAPTHNLAEASVLERTLGTVPKLVAALERLDWQIRNRGKIDVSTYSVASDGMYITVSATKDNLSLYLRFEHIPNTATCKLVERDVTVASEYIPEHTEKRMVVECTD